jgi:N-methylhydantoinase A/oxoprolinase/acetone carboxylase beta subunit
LLTTQGFRDVIAMGNEAATTSTTSTLSCLNRWCPPPPPALAERMDNEGNVLLPLDSDAVRA